MKRSLFLQRLCAGGLLIALGVVIPMFSPVKIIIPPAASFTLASHVPIFLAMFISPAVAAAVAVGTTLGFFLGGFPLVIVLRAATHLVFATVGAFLLRRRPSLVFSLWSSQLFSLLIGLIHAVCEVLVVALFYLGGAAAETAYQQGFFVSVVLLVGAGSVVHSMVDFAISLVIFRPLVRQQGIAGLFSVRPKPTARQDSMAG